MKKLKRFYLNFINETEEEFEYELKATVVTIMFIILLMAESGVKM